MCFRRGCTLGARGRKYPPLGSTAAVGVYVAVAPQRLAGWSCNEEQAGQAFYVERSQITTKSARRTKKTRAFRSNLSGGMEARFERRAYDER